jgi:hypothetical protein
MSLIPAHSAWSSRCWFMDALNPLDHKVFQLRVRGMTMTLLIAMEFKHSIVKVALRKESIIQVKTVILIAILALARKLIILEPDVDPAKVAVLAAPRWRWVLTYWLLRERDDRAAENLSMTRHHPSDPRTAVLQHRWLNRLQTGLLVLTLVGIAAAAGSLLFGEDWPVARAVCHCIDPAAGTGSRLRDDLAPVPRPGLAPA